MRADLAAVDVAEALAAADEGHRAVVRRHALAEQPGRVLTHHMLLERVWGPGYDRELHYLRVYVNRLRRKIEPDPGTPHLLVTVPRAGYRLEALPAE